MTSIDKIKIGDEDRWKNLPVEKRGYNWWKKKPIHFNSKIILFGGVNMRF